MSDRDEVMSLSDSVSNENSSDESSSDEMEVVGIVQPYAYEPLAHTSDEDEDDEEDQDGLTPAVLRARFEDEVTVKDWLVPAAAALKRLDVIFALGSKILLQTICLCGRCTCGECAKENLTGALEYRCYKDIVQIRQKLTFDGSIEHLKCITKHGDFSAMTNRTVLLQVGPLLRDKNGKVIVVEMGKLRTSEYRIRGCFSTNI